MAIIKVHHVKLVAQPKNALCWLASAQMCYLWSQATGRGSMIDPLDDSTGFRQRYNANLTWDQIYSAIDTVSNVANPSFLAAV